jgi:phosphoglucomutase
VISPLAGKPAPSQLLVDIGHLIQAYFSRPTPADPAQLVSFGTSGHRGTSLTGSFNEAHIVAITQAICEHRAAAGISGPMFVGIDTHALSRPALDTALEVLAANGVDTRIAPNDLPTPTPVVSHAILAHNRTRNGGVADGIVITPSHNPPSDGGFKYDPPSGGPADSVTTRAIQDRANELLTAGVSSGMTNVHRRTSAQARVAASTFDFLTPYVADLRNVVDLDAINSAGVLIGVDPLGGASAPYWPAIADHYGLHLTVTNPRLDPTFGFMTVDGDGKIRMDPSSPYVMASLLKHQHRFDVALACDADADRHGVVTPAAGLLNPNHYLAVLIEHLYRRRTDWPQAAAVGKTVVSSSVIDRVTAGLGRRLVEVPVGFKWFVDGLFDGSIAFGGEESAGASCLRRDGQVWTTDKDGIMIALLAAEVTAAGTDPGVVYQQLCEKYGGSDYRRLDTPADAKTRAAVGALGDGAGLDVKTLAGEPVQEVLTKAPGNGAAIGGVKVLTESAWFALRPSGTEAICKLYAESQRGPEHLDQVITEAQTVLTDLSK